jgi:hypothetical protein
MHEKVVEVKHWLLLVVSFCVCVCVLCVEFPCVQSLSLFRTRICGCELVDFVLPNTVQILLHISWPATDCTEAAFFDFSNRSRPSTAGNFVVLHLESKLNFEARSAKEQRHIFFTNQNCEGTVPIR